ncbi:MAG: sigma-54 dependent transcriptional regulator [Polyangiaceae bacterium]
MVDDEHGARHGDGVAASRVLVVDDDAPLGTVLAGLLRQGGFDADVVTSGEEGLRRFDEAPYDAVLTDLRMPGMDGVALLERLRARGEEVPVVLLSAHGTLEIAVEAMKRGATDFLTKPFDREEILATLSKAVELGRAAERRPPPLPARLGRMVVGASPAMRASADLIGRAAATTAHVLIRGESGTGKEVAARAIHAQGPRAEEPFVAVSCAALPEHLLESELFGYEKGAFTGAAVRKPGRVELAASGTLFLDEIGDVSLAVQVKLLRLLQEHEYQPLGGTQLRRMEARIIAATHRDLEALVAEGSFREDLLYRLDVIPIVMPPLRERPEDIPVLARDLCERLAAQNGVAGRRLEDDAVALLAGQPFPGNVRELSNLVERLIVFSDGDIGVADVERELARRREQKRPSSTSPSSSPSSSTTSLAERRAEADRQALADALARAGGNRTQAARLLGISRRQLYNLMDSMT